MEPLRQTVTVPIQDASQVSLARRAAHEAAAAMGMDEVRTGEVEIVTVELANNLLQHAGRGELLLNPFRDKGALELIASDRGPGMANLAECLADGFSTGTTPGLGLGAVQRLSKRMDCWSWPGKGAIIAAQFTAQPAADGPVNLPGVVCTPVAGETVSGDWWACTCRDGRNLYMVVDGLGHGAYAAEAAQTAVHIFLTATVSEPARLIEQMHGPMRSTRGAAIAIAAVDAERKTIAFAGLGNVSALVESAGERASNLVSLNGTLGHQMRRVQAFEYPWKPGSLLIMHSDGVSTHWRLSDYPGLHAAATPVIAAVLHRDYQRERDDSTVLVVRLG